MLFSPCSPKNAAGKCRLLQEWDDVFFKVVHLCKEGSIWEVAPKESDKCLDVLFCYKIKKFTKV